MVREKRSQHDSCVLSELVVTCGNDVVPRLHSVRAPGGPTVIGTLSPAEAPAMGTFFRLEPDALSRH